MKRLSLAIVAVVLGLLLAGNYINPSVQDDLRFPSSGINPPGAASDPTRSQTTGMLEFAAGSDKVIAGNFQLPHAWKAGTTISPHIHLMFPTGNTNVSKWRLDYTVANINGNFSAGNYGAYTSLPVVTVTNPNSVQKHGIFNVGTIDLANYTESCVVMWKLTRVDSGNTDASTIVLLDFDVHYEVEQFGKTIVIP